MRRGYSLQPANVDQSTSDTPLKLGSDSSGLVVMGLTFFFFVRIIIMTSVYHYNGFKLLLINIEIRHFVLSQLCSYIHSCQLTNFHFLVEITNKSEKKNQKGGGYLKQLTIYNIMTRYIKCQKGEKAVYMYYACESHTLLLSLTTAMFYVCTAMFECCGMINTVELDCHREN